jgi:hypothetical protein
MVLDFGIILWTLSGIPELLNAESERYGKEQKYFRYKPAAE